MLRVLQHKDINYQFAKFETLPAYIYTLEQRDPEGVFPLTVNITTSRFERIFICPSANKHALNYCTSFIAVDGTFTKTSFRQTLLFAVTLDGNHEIVPLV